jgi:DnaA family protein
MHPALEEQTADSDAVAVDDVDRLSGPHEIALFNLYNRLREEGGILLAAGNAPPAQLALRADVVTRLGWGLVYQVHALSDEEMAEAVVQHAAVRGFRLERDVQQYLLNRVQRDMPTLLAMLDALDRYSREEKRAITVPLLRELLGSGEIPARRQ